MRQTLFRWLLGSRLPDLDGVVRVAGLSAAVTIRRDTYGIPHIEAETAADAHFALGYCQGQDRAFQLEATLRVGRGTLSEMVGKEGLPVDRLSRRIGFDRAAKEQWPLLGDVAKETLGSFVAGVNAGYAKLPKKPHELALLGGELTPWEPSDVLAFLKFTSFLLPGNWDVELARLRILLADGPEALRKVDPAFAQVPSEPMLGISQVVEALSRELAAFQERSPTGGGSNNFVIRGDRTLSGKPLLANDPHLGPTIPAPWYLAHITTPDWSVAGATFAGSPTFPIGHNGTLAWGVTAGLTDNTDLWIETEPATNTLREVIAVKGGAEVVEEVQITPRGPIISPLLEGVPYAISLEAVWLKPLPIDGFLTSAKATTVEGFRAPFAQWPGLPLNVVYAHTNGETGYQLIGQVPIREGHSGLFPGDPKTSRWKAMLDFDQMPRLSNPAFHATANNPPATDAWLGADYIEHYRSSLLLERLEQKASHWTINDCLELQKNLRSKPWGEFRDVVLALPATGLAAEAIELFRAWDGHMNSNSAAATIWNWFLRRMAIHLAQEAAPNSWADSLGGMSGGLFGTSLLSDRWVGPTIARLKSTMPTVKMLEMLADIIRDLKANHGPSPEWWQWGDLRPLLVKHQVLGDHWLLGPIFNLPLTPIGGDSNTINQAGARPLSEPGEPTHNIANLRVVFDLSDWGSSRVDLCGGQSGNPYSEHYADLFALRERDDSAKLLWTNEEIHRATRHTLRLIAE
ncbi:MAG: penicillin acylase family protein [Fimbriiglobus sp.]